MRSGLHPKRPKDLEPFNEVAAADASGAQKGPDTVERVTPACVNLSGRVAELDQKRKPGASKLKAQRGVGKGPGEVEGGMDVGGLGPELAKARHCGPGFLALETGVLGG